jgi:hypothetical protein
LSIITKTGRLTPFDRSDKVDYNNQSIKLLIPPLGTKTYRPDVVRGIGLYKLNYIQLKVVNFYWWKVINFVIVSRIRTILVKSALFIKASYYV